MSRSLAEAAVAGAPRLAESDYREAERLLRNGWVELGRQQGRLPPLRDFARADSLLTEAANAAERAARRAGTMLADRRHEEEGAEAVQRWKSWVSRAVEASRSGGGPAVVVDKSVHRLHLLFAGEVVASFPCDLGYNPGAQKHSAGDGATPEGLYRVTAVRWNGSRYHRALLLDYPNESDRERYRALVRTGVVPSHARIGGNIEIHGEGGIGRDWTDGCVALADTDIERLMRHAREGMPMAIVRKAVGWP